MSFGRPSKQAKSEPKDRATAAYDAAAQRLRDSARVLADTLRRKAGFNPNQPRVPSGRREGGRWTNGGGGSGTPSRASPPKPNAETSEWTTISASRRADGSIAAETVINPAGDAIHSEFSIPTDGVAWDERHTVRSADGSIATFQNSGLSQLVFDGEGQLVSHAVWTPQGPERQPIQAAAFPLAIPLIELAPAAIEKTIELGLTLYSGLLALSGHYDVGQVDPRSRKQDRLPVLGFVAREYRQGGATAGLELGYVGNLTREEVEAACPRMQEVQEIVDRSAADTNRSLYASPALYGTAVHTRVSGDIRTLDDPDLKAEISFLKTLDETGTTLDRTTTYGMLSSIRVDVHERAPNFTACVYDIKTGKSGLSGPRFAEIASAVLLNQPSAKRVIVIEMRPTW